MPKVIALMSMSLDGYVADANDGVDEVFDWYFSGDVEVPMPIPTPDFTFHVSAQSAEHLRGLMAETGAFLTGRRTFDKPTAGVASTRGCARVRRHPPRARRLARPGSTVQFVTDGIESAVAQAKSAAGPKSVAVHAPRRSSSAWMPGCSTRSRSI